MLTDRQIYDAIAAGDLRLENAALTDDDYGKDAPVQPASLDLHVGEIFLPTRWRRGLFAGLALGRRPDVPRGRVEHDLRQGETAFVRTLERIKLSSSLSAFGFPPSEVSTAGVLMTNPGHIDPGYEGYLHFTIVNMGRELGREPFNLKQGNRIVTLLLVKLASPATADYGARRNGQITPLNVSDAVQPLSQDFLDLERRAAEIAGRKIDAAELKIKYGTPILVAVITALGAIGGGFFFGLFDVVKQDDLSKLIERVTVLEAAISRYEFDTRLKRLEDALQLEPDSRSQGGDPRAH